MSESKERRTASMKLLRVDPSSVDPIVIRNERGTVVAKCAERKTAETFVRAVNNHEVLVTTLRQMLNVFFPHTCLPGSVCARCEILVTGQRALALAEKES